MFPAAVLVLWFHMFALAKSEQNVTLTFERSFVTRKLTCVNNDLFYLLEDVPTMMYINKPINEKVILEHFECYRFDNTSIKLVFEELSPRMYDFEVPMQYISSIVNDNYKCYFLMNKNAVPLIQPHIVHDGNTYVKVECMFRLAIKYQKSLKVEINGNAMENEPVIGSNEIDAKVIYKFVPDELVHINCKRPFYQNGTIQFLYMADHPYTSVPSFGANNDFEVILKRYHDGLHIDCIYDAQGFKTVLRVYMVLEKKHVENIIRVNGLAIRQRQNIVKYFYIDTVPSVSCPGPAVVKLCDKSCNDVEAVADCKNEGKIQKVEMFKDYSRNGIYIGGLIDSKITFQTYTNGNKSRIIHYECTTDDVVALNPLYVNEKEDVYCKINGLSSDAEAQKSLKLRLREEYNITSVTCSTKLFRTDILFHYVKNNAPINNKPAPSSNIPSDRADQDKYYLFKVMIAPVILLIVLLLGMAVAVRKIRDSAGEITNLSWKSRATASTVVEMDWLERSDTTISHKPVEQSEEAIDRTKNITNTQNPKRVNTDIRTLKKPAVCTAGVPKNQRSVYYIGKHHNFYPKPIPKNRRVANNELTYAELEFSNEPRFGNTSAAIHLDNQQSVYSEVRHVQPNCLYAEVIHKDHHVDYVNCSNDFGYANTVCEDYGSSYCGGDDCSGYD